VKNKPHLNLLINHEFNIFEQLQLEEAILRINSDNWCLINFGTLPAIVCGAFGCIEKLIDIKKASQMEIPVIRRFSGGGTVVVEKNTLFITFIMNHKSLEVRPFPKAIMEWSAKLFKPAFSQLNFDLNESDYVITSQNQAALKIAGNAQSITKNRWLHHTSFLWDFSPQLMDLLHLPQRQPKYREKRPHQNFITPLLPHLGPCLKWIESFKNHLQNHFILKNELLKNAEEHLKIPHRKSVKYL
jgi:lipoate---protein ligase